MAMNLNKDTAPKVKKEFYEKKIRMRIDNELYAKYTKGEFSYDVIQTNYLLCNEKCRVVARFKDFLVLDDNTEFFRRFYTSEESRPRLRNILNFYETYSKIFPNYMILPENEYLYRNIRKKQKMIDAFNQIKLEEEENRKNLNIGLKSKNKNENNNIVFDDKIKQSINNYKQSEIDDSVSISLMSRRPTTTNIFTTPSSSFIVEDSLASIAVIVNGMDNKNVETPKRTKSKNTKEDNDDNDEINDSQRIQSALNNNRKFISHKATVSVPELTNKSIKIINNYHNIIIPQGTNTVININTNYYQCDKKITAKSKPLNTIAATSVKKSVSKSKATKSTSKNKQIAYSNRKKDSKSSFKSPEKVIDPVLSLKKKNITTTISTVSHVMPIYKNKNIYKISTLSAMKDKVNPFKSKFEKIKMNYNTANNSTKKDIVTSFTAHHPTMSTAKKELKITLVTEGDKTSMKTKYKDLLDKSKNSMRKSYDTNTKMHTMPSASSSKNTSMNSQRKITNLKSPMIKSIGMSPKVNSIIESRIPLTAKIKLSNKSPLHKEMNVHASNPSRIIKSINFKGMDVNTKKMKFVKK